MGSLVVGGGLLGRLTKGPMLEKGRLVPIEHRGKPNTLLTVVEQEIGPGAVQQLDGPTWHLVDAVDSRTLCGLAIHYGARRKLWAETSEDDRCALCKRRIGAAASD